MKELDYINEIAVIIGTEYMNYEDSTDKASRSAYDEIKARMYEVIDQYFEEGKITQSGHDSLCVALEDVHTKYCSRALYR